MALGFDFSTAESGDIIPIIKFDAKAGRMFRRDRVNGENDIVDITRSFKAVFDFENIEVGTINFDTGSAPDFAVARIGETPPPKPSDKHRPGARILVKLSKENGGDIRELASTAKAFLRGLEAVHDDYMAGVKANPGKLPVVSLADTTPITSGEGAKKSTNYSPVFQIVSWVDRPTDLVYVPKGRSSNAAAAPAATPPSTGSNKVSAPADDYVPGFDDDDDFG
jgi:hypothetical protein